MKKIVSLLLIVAMVCSLGLTAFATNDYTQGTLVVYNGTGAENYTITVPALLTPGQSGTVTLEGMWADNRIVTVTADPTVTLKNNIKETDTKTLSVNFAGISEAGSNTTSQTFTKDISVDGITDALFGTWSGKFNYNVKLADRAVVGYSYNGITLPALPQDIDYNEFVFSGISELNGMYMLTLSTLTPRYSYANDVPISYNGTVANFTGYSAYWQNPGVELINKNYIVSNGEWVSYSEDRHYYNNAWGVIQVGEGWQAPTPTWVNRTLLNEDEEVYLAASTPIPVYE